MTRDTATTSRMPADTLAAPRHWRMALLVVGWFNLVSAVGGALGLVFANGMGMPLSWLAGTPFDSFVIPGLVLLLIVGGTQGLAVLLQHRRHPWFPAAAGVAGFGMVIWIYVEVALLPVYSILHTIYFTTGVLQLIFLLLCLGILPADRMARTAK
ncbi:hypothetical protein BJQ94_03160 [Cryobacterium sp. SO2]|uniref:hypothetical protein n=1 Tax=Cryobacterium sp. SO2 TaxID=1897060 RepID=UPI00223D2095|nr:hypothetical protein [Cryobacterium sp. SO2]WEO78052.1 hypothetical protein BJQ94_03160 [Cryobacterium sp. SO2]